MKTTTKECYVSRFIMKVLMDLENVFPKLQVYTRFNVLSITQGKRGLYHRSIPLGNKSSQTNTSSSSCQM